jgi:hypothetical protein
MGRTIQEKISPTKQTLNSTSVSLLNFARLFHQKRIILNCFLFGISRQKHLPQQRLQLKRPFQKKVMTRVSPRILSDTSNYKLFLTAMKVNDLNIKPSISKEDIVENLLMETADPIPFGPSHWQGNNNMGNNVTPRNPHSIITEGG